MKKPVKIQVDKTLWSVPKPVLDRLNSSWKNSESTEFLLCGLYCLVAIFFLVFFGVAAIFRQEFDYAFVIFGFAVSTIISYGAIWLSGYLFLAKHLVVLLMASLCLYLFYTGGTQGTGPIYFFIFPSVALFLQGFRQGQISVVVLLSITLVIYGTELFGFDASRYDFIYISRIFTVYIIVSILSMLFSYFRQLAERELLLTQEDMDQISFADRLTGMANRNLMERLLHTEFNRYKRYNSAFSIMHINVDSYDMIEIMYGEDFGAYLIKTVTKFINTVVRSQDIPCRWERDEFLVLLPETGVDGAWNAAERLRGKIESHQFSNKGKSQKITVSIGISQVREDDDISGIVNRAGLCIHQARAKAGNCVVTDNEINQAAAPI